MVLGPTVYYCLRCWCVTIWPAKYQFTFALISEVWSIHEHLLMHLALTILHTSYYLLDLVDCYFIYCYRRYL